MDWCGGEYENENENEYEVHARAAGDADGYSRPAWERGRLARFAWFGACA